jgi:hypothetical protein
MLMERQKLYESYIKLDWQKQLANLASTFANLSKHVIQPESDSLAKLLLREAALMIEWSAPNIPKPYLLELATMQREVLAWLKIFPIEQARNLLSLQSRDRSDRLLQIAGYFDI